MDTAEDHGEGEPDARVPTRLSACIIARDEAERLPACLASIAFCGEIVLVDSGSVDQTIELARAAGARVFSQPWLGFAAQRNAALDHARGDWVIEIDADERVSPELRGEIEAFLDAPPHGVELGAFPLRDLLRGRALGRSAKYPKYRHRLLLRGSYRHDERRTVHEGLTPAGDVHPFTGDLLHVLADSWGEAVSDAWAYARLESGQLHARRSPRAVLMGSLVRPSLKFVYRLTIDGGWRDGRYGWAKIALDCASDSAVWLRHLCGRRGEASGHSGRSSSEHYGLREAHLGSARVVALAAGRRAGASARDWLRAAKEAGLDAALIADTPGNGAVRTRQVCRMRPIQIARALEAEQQLRTIDVVIPFGRRARGLARMIPGRLPGIVRGVSEHEGPSSVGARVQEQRRLRGDAPVAPDVLANAGTPAADA